MFKGVAVSSILCTLCNHWVHKRCSGLKSKLASAINFKCKACLDPQVSDDDYKAVELDGNKYEVVKQVCYLGDMIIAGGGAEASTIARVRSGWKSFRVLLPLLASRVISLKTKERLYAACVRSVMVHGSETWPLKVEGIRISRADKMMIRWMCNVSLKDGKSLDELRDRPGIPDIAEVLRKNRLRWFGHVMRMDARNPASACRHVVVEGKRKQGRLRKT